jgi:septal ring factor EnvC (AmiA/AmiB activator)
LIEWWHLVRCGAKPARVLSRALLAVVLTLSVVSAVSAQSGDEIGTRLQTIRLEVTTTQKTINKLKADFTKLKKDEKTLAAEIEGLRKEETTLTDKGVAVSRQRVELESRVKTAEAKVLEEQGKIRERLRALYTNTASGNQSGAAWLLGGSNIEQLAVYARAVRRFDEVRFEGVKQAVAVLIENRQALDKSLEEGAKLQQEVQAKRVESEQKQEKLKSVLQEIKDKQQAAQQSLASLKGEAGKLEELLQQITTTDTRSSKEQENAEAPETPAPIATPTAAAAVASVKLDSKTEKPVESDSEVMNPEGLFGRTVRITYPVQGQVLQKFGKSKLTEFEDMIFSKGLEFKTPEASQVLAVLGGKVAFAGSMPGFEMVVIIDHGARSYSLYGRLGKTFVNKGDSIKRGDSLGVTSAPDSKGRNFYFETRKNGSPVDPATVLARAS